MTDHPAPSPGGSISASFLKRPDSASTNPVDTAQQSFKFSAAGPKKHPPASGSEMKLPVPDLDGSTTGPPVDEPMVFREEREVEQQQSVQNRMVQKEMSPPPPPSYQPEKMYREEQEQVPQQQQRVQNRMVQHGLSPPPSHQPEKLVYREEREQVPQPQLQQQKQRVQKRRVQNDGGAMHVDGQKRKRMEGAPTVQNQQRQHQQRPQQQFHSQKQQQGIGRRGNVNPQLGTFSQQISQQQRAPPQRANYQPEVITLDDDEPEVKTEIEEGVFPDAVNEIEQVLGDEREGMGLQHTPNTQARPFPAVDRRQHEPRQQQTQSGDFKHSQHPSFSGMVQPLQQHSGMSQNHLEQPLHQFSGKEQPPRIEQQIHRGEPRRQISGMSRQDSSGSQRKAPSSRRSSMAPPPPAQISTPVLTTPTKSEPTEGQSAIIEALGAVNRENTALKASLESMKEDLGKQNAQLEEIGAQKIQLESKTSSLESEKEKLASKLSSTLKSVTELSGRVKASQTYLNGLGNDYNLAAKHNDALKRLVDELKTEKLVLMEEHSELKEGVKRGVELFESRKRKQAELQASVIAYKSMTERIGFMEADLQEKTGLLAEARSRTQNLETNLQDERNLHREQLLGALLTVREDFAKKLKRFGEDLNDDSESTRLRLVEMLGDASKQSSTEAQETLASLAINSDKIDTCVRRIDELAEDKPADINEILAPLLSSTTSTADVVNEGLKQTFGAFDTVSERLLQLSGKTENLCESSVKLSDNLVCSLQKEITAIKKEAALAVDREREADSARAEAEGKLANASEMIKELRGQVRQLQLEKDVLVEKLAEISSTLQRLAEAPKEDPGLHSTVVNLEHRIAEFSREQDESDRNVLAMQGTIAAKDVELSEVRRDFSETLERLKSSNDRIGLFENEKTKYIASIDEQKHEERIQYEKDARRFRETQVNRLENQIKNLEGQKRDLEMKLDEKSGGSGEPTTSQLDSTAVMELESEKAQLERTCESLQNEVQKLHEEVRKLQQTSEVESRLQQALQKCQLDNDTLEREAHEWQNNYMMAEDENSMLSQSLEAAEKQTRQLQESNNNLLVERQLAKENYESVESQSRGLEKAKSELEARCKELEADRAEQYSKVHELLDANQNLTTNRDAAVYEMRELKEKLQRSKDELARLDGMRDKMARLQEQVDELNSDPRERSRTRSSSIQGTLYSSAKDVQIPSTPVTSVSPHVSSRAHEQKDSDVLVPNTQPFTRISSAFDTDEERQHEDVQDAQMVQEQLDILNSLEIKTPRKERNAVSSALSSPVSMVDIVGLPQRSQNETTPMNKNAASPIRPPKLEKKKQLKPKPVDSGSQEGPSGTKRKRASDTSFNAINVPRTRGTSGRASLPNMFDEILDSQVLAEEASEESQVPPPPKKARIGKSGKKTVSRKK